MTWITPSIAACAYPDNDYEMAELAEEGVSLIINLHTRAHPIERLAQFGMTEVHLPTRDFTAPKLSDIETGVAAVDRALSEGRRVAVHCGAGLGRTGTFVACYLVSTGLSATEAIETVRGLRPGSVETFDQEALVHEYEALLRRRRHN